MKTTTFYETHEWLEDCGVVVHSGNLNHQFCLKNLKRAMNTGGFPGGPSIWPSSGGVIPQSGEYLEMLQLLLLPSKKAVLLLSIGGAQAWFQGEETKSPSRTESLGPPLGARLFRKSSSRRTKGREVRVSPTSPVLSPTRAFMASTVKKKKNLEVGCGILVK